MALASYGDSEQAAGTLDNYVPKYCDGELNAPHDYGINFAWDDGGQEHYHFADAGAIADVIRRCGRQHVAAEAQRVLEDRVQQLVHPWLRREGVRNLSCGGGVFLNVKLNQRMWESGLVDHHHIYPNPGDAGLAAGAAMYAHRQLSGESPMHALRTMSLGPSFSNDEIERALGERGIEARRHEDVAELAAGLLATGSIVAWFQGRMESGPRALGHRSLLMSAGHERNKDIMNERVKFRETFRPFGPSLCQERGAELLTRCRAEPFMITSFDATSAGRQAMPAVIHVDGTVRPQTVDVAVNPTYHRLLEHVNRLTDEPAVLNTSFNLAGEPLVCSPRDAIRSFFDAGADHLIMGDCWVRKAP
jgi:carbamoyltransferase